MAHCLTLGWAAIACVVSSVVFERICGKNWGFGLALERRWQATVVSGVYKEQS
jgi:hypothetical protein